MFGENLRKIREYKKLTQKDLAQILNISEKTISHWEQNYTEPSIAMIKKIKEELDLSYDELFE